MKECDHITDYYLCKYSQRHNDSSFDHPCKFAMLELGSNKTWCMNININISEEYDQYKEEKER